MVGLMLVCVLAFSPKVRAITAAEVQAQITALLAQIKQLQEQLAQIQGNQAVAWCHTFNTNLGVGARGIEAQNLLTALGREGVWSGESGCQGDGEGCNMFDEGVASVIVEFQEKYASEILAPYKLKRGTGYVGKSTRAKLNKLYGCATQPVVCPADVKLCPDGSYVARVAPSCEFAQCPTLNCLKEGEIGQPTAALAKECCSGLKSVNQINVYDTSCNLTPEAQIAHRLDYVCTACGNGVCGLGENKCNCPSDCNTAAATTTLPSCFDSDGGLDYYVKGFTEGYSELGVYWGASRDFCQNTTLLMEYSCKDGHDYMSSFDCPYGCENGACKQASVTSCTDSDGYKSFYTKGKAYGRHMGEIKWWEDYCVANNNSVYDFTCRANVYSDSDILDVWADSLVCPAGCFNGACQRLSLLQPNISSDSYSIIKWLADLETGSKINLDLINQTCLSKLAVGADKEQCIKAISHGLNPQLGIYYWTNQIIFMIGSFTATDEYRVRIQEIKSTGAFGAQDQSGNTFKLWL